MSLHSMTGFGRGEAPIAGRRVTAELRTVNHRFLDLKLRLGREDVELEAELGKLVRGRLQRGAVSVTLREEEEQGGAEAGALVDEEKARLWAAALTRLGAAIGRTEPPSLELICAQPGVVRARNAETPRAELLVAAKMAVAAALDELVAARAREGHELVRELSGRLASLGRLRSDVVRLAASEPLAQRDRISARVSALLEGRPGVTLDPQRLAQEIALLAERLDVTEELTRLNAHLDEARRLLDGKEAAGRRLDFLSQEILREVNTIGSKSQSTEIAARIIDMKAELERFREQVQNLE